MASRFPLLLQECRARLDRLKRNKHFTFGLPFLIFVVGGSFALREFAKVRYEFTQVNPFELPVEKRVQGSKPVDPEKEFDDIMKKIDIHNWENKRIPRPWEEGESSG